MERRRRRTLTVSLTLLAVVAVIVGTTLQASRYGRLSTAPQTSPADCVTAAFPGGTRAPAPTPDGWSGVWSTSLQDLDGPDLSNRTLRQIVRPTAGGTSLRIRLANTFGAQALRLSRATVAVAVADGSPDLRSGTVRQVTFDGSPHVEISPGAETISDPVDLVFSFGQSLAVDLVPQGPATAGSGHSRAIATSYLGEGDLAGEISGSAFAGTVRSWFWLEGVDVPDPFGGGTISAFGDSITEGMSSTVDGNQRWPDLLSARLRADPNIGPVGVLNEGIGGNRVVTENLSCLSPSASGLRRFHHDVLSRSDVRVVVIALGINDIGAGTSANRIIEGLTALAERARENGLRVVATTLAPYGCPGGCLSPEKERRRAQVNAWIRSTGSFDAVVDVDAALRDPADPQRLRPAYDSGDGLHPSDAGMQALAASFDLPALLGPG